MYKLISREKSKRIRSDGFMHLDYSPSKTFKTLLAEKMSIIYSRYKESNDAGDYRVFDGYITPSDKGGLCVVSSISLCKSMLDCYRPSTGLIYEMFDMAVLELIDVVESNDQSGIMLGSNLPITVDVLLDRGFSILPRNESVDLFRGIKKLNNTVGSI